MASGYNRIARSVIHLMILVCLAHGFTLGFPTSLSQALAAIEESSKESQHPSCTDSLQTETEKDTNEPQSTPANQTNENDKSPEVKTPDDPSLPSLYKDWSEFSADSEEYRRKNRIAGARIVINLQSYNLVLEAISDNGDTKSVVSQNVGVGNIQSPTPEGEFIINHIYCYPDVLLFDANSNPVPGVYDGFFAPLLVCDGKSNCRRVKELGLHGFQGKFYPNFAGINPGTSGAVSAGCVRIPNPSSFKMELIRVVGIGPIKKNERGSFHWLKKPIPVVVRGYDYDQEMPTLVSIIEQSISSIGGELHNIFKSLYE